ncbi:MAG TPA: transglycosylase SLT domain-containing protein [Casimicrobiaceae bacterium]|nr:transglycosylase SLT domain-containing protein [Casimicrobiaceae bacterium]
MPEERPTRPRLAPMRLTGMLLALVALLVCLAEPAPPSAPDRTLVVALLRAPVSLSPTGLAMPTGLNRDLVEAYAAARGLAVTIIEFEDAEALLSKVAAGEAHVGVGALATASQGVLWTIAPESPAGPPAGAWAVAPDREALRDDIDRYFAAAQNDGLLASLADRYFGPAVEIERIDAGIFRDRVQTVLPRYRRWFEEAQAATGLPWRLVAAVAYQESQWDPEATSETGVRGFMQITSDTAQRLGIVDRLDPYASIVGAAHYLAFLKSHLPARITEPDRTWLALAAFNIGAGHLEDARILAQRQRLDPDRWTDVRQVLPLLALPEHYESARNGYARGGMPVVFVDRVRAYYDIMLRRVPAVDAFMLAANP